MLCTPAPVGDVSGMRHARGVARIAFCVCVVCRGTCQRVRRPPEVSFLYTKGFMLVDTSGCLIQVGAKQHVPLSQEVCTSCCARRHSSRRRESERASATSRRSISMNDNVTRAAAVARASEAGDDRATPRGPVLNEGLPLTAPKAGSGGGGGGGLGSGGKTSTASGSGSDVRTSLRLSPDA